MTLALNCLLIILARIADVSLGTLRTVAVINGRRHVALVLGFFEVLIWILVVSRVVTQAAAHPLYALAYATGFASGNFIGITIEKHLAFGWQVVRIFTRANGIADALRDRGYRVTIFDGRGRDGPVEQLFIQTERKRVIDLCSHARELDPNCFYVIDDIREASAALTTQQRSFWRNITKFK